MTAQTELEKTQLEIAQLQLEQERRKLEQMQKRDAALRGVGAGAAAVGNAVKSGTLWTLCVGLGAVFGGSMGWLVGAFFALVTSKFACQAHPGADFLYRVGCAIGENHWWAILMAGAMTLYGVYVGHKIAITR